MFPLSDFHCIEQNIVKQIDSTVVALNVISLTTKIDLKNASLCKLHIKH